MRVRKFKIKVQNIGESVSDSFGKNFISAWKLAEKRKLSQSDYDLILTFPDISWLSKIFSPERLKIIQTIRVQKPESIYQLAKILNRVPNNVQRDIHDLVKLGIVELKKRKKKGQKRQALKPQYNWDGFDIAV